MSLSLRLTDSWYATPRVEGSPASAILASSCASISALCLRIQGSVGSIPSSRSQDRSFVTDGTTFVVELERGSVWRYVKILFKLLFVGFRVNKKAVVLVSLERDSLRGLRARRVSDLVALLHLLGQRF